MDMVKGTPSGSTAQVVVTVPGYRVLWEGTRFVVEEAHYAMVGGQQVTTWLHPLRGTCLVAGMVVNALLLAGWVQAPSVCPLCGKLVMPSIGCDCTRWLNGFPG